MLRVKKLLPRAKLSNTNPLMMYFIAKRIGFFRCVFALCAKNVLTNALLCCIIINDITLSRVAEESGPMKPGNLFSRC